MKKITIIGTGYVGLVTGACLAEMGNLVTCLDIDQEKISSLKVGNLPFYEPGLKELVHKGIASTRLQFTDQYTQAIPGTEICFFALPTPSKSDESCDLDYILLAAKQVAEVMNNYLVIVNKSTVPVGTGERLRGELLKHQPSPIPFDIVSNPEFLREGTAVNDCMHPDRILLGIDSKNAEQQMKELYAQYLDQVMVMDIPSAELAKYAANTMLATRISLMNELAGLCEKLGADIESVRIAMGADERIGTRYLSPGIGFGGSCLPKDVKALRSTAKQNDHPCTFFDSILEINERQRKHFFDKIMRHFGSLKGITLGIWGLAFKPDTDDLREAPSLYLIEKFLEAGANLRIYDPVSMPKAKKFLKNDEIQFCEDASDAAEEVDALILVTEWSEFQTADFKKIGPLMKQKILFDGRNQYKEMEMEELGFTYFRIGKTPSRELVHAS